MSADVAKIFTFILIIKIDTVDGEIFLKRSPNIFVIIKMFTSHFIMLLYLVSCLLYPNNPELHHQTFRNKSNCVIRKTVSQ